MTREGQLRAHSVATAILGYENFAHTRPCSLSRPRGNEVEQAGTSPSAYHVSGRVYSRESLHFVKLSNAVVPTVMQRTVKTMSRTHVDELKSLTIRKAV